MSISYVTRRTEERPTWAPQEGPQAEFFYSDVYEILYGGSAGAPEWNFRAPEWNFRAPQKLSAGECKASARKLRLSWQEVQAGMSIIYVTPFTLFPHKPRRGTKRRVVKKLRNQLKKAQRIDFNRHKGHHLWASIHISNRRTAAAIRADFSVLDRHQRSHSEPCMTELHDAGSVVVVEREDRSEAEGLATAEEADRSTIGALRAKMDV